MELKMNPVQDSAKHAIWDAINRRNSIKSKAARGVSRLR